MSLRVKQYYQPFIGFMAAINSRTVIKANVKTFARISTTNTPRSTDPFNRIECIISKHLTPNWWMILNDHKNRADKLRTQVKDTIGQRPCRCPANPTKYFHWPLSPVKIISNDKPLDVQPFLLNHTLHPHDHTLFVCPFVVCNVPVRGHSHN